MREKTYNISKQKILADGNEMGRRRGVWRRDDAMHFADGNEMGKGAGQDTRNYKQEDLYYVVCEKWINP